MGRMGILRSIIGILTIAFLACGGNAWAQPSLIVSDQGANGAGNREWLVQVVPNAAPIPGAVSVELAFEVSTGSLVGATYDATPWEFLNPGNNPFTGGVTLGLQTETGAGTVFFSAGGGPFTTTAPINTLTIETLGMGQTTLDWGGQTLLTGQPFEYVGSRISQGGVNFDGIMGSLTAGESGVTGDFNGDMLWNCSDIDALTNAVATMSTDLAFDMNGDGQITFADVNDPVSGWLTVGGANNTNTGGNPYLAGDANLDGFVDTSDFNIWNSNKFNSSTAWCAGNFNGDLVVDTSDFNVWNSNKFRSSSPAAVPEPSVCLSLLLAWGIVAARAARRR